MNNARVFVSSTCYDLAAMREDLRAMIIELGHEPLLSEYPSFPVSIEESAVGNCRRNVREHTDVLILIVGGRRGSLDPESGKPVTNLEYDEAVRCDIPVYVFFQRSVLNLLPIWKNNPGADFTSAVDYPAVFSFIERIRASGAWTFSFERTEEIKHTLRLQLSGLFKDLLERRRGGRLDPLPEFASESPRAKQLALDKPKYWEYLLAAELLRTKLAAVRRLQSDVAAGLVHKELQRLKASEVLGWVQIKLTEITVIVERFRPAFDATIVAIGLPGLAGDAIEIKKAVTWIATHAEEMVKWEIDIKRVRVPETLQKLISLLPCFKVGVLEQLETIAPQIDEFFAAGDPKPGSELDIRVNLNAPPSAAFHEEMAWLGKHHYLLRD